MVFLPPPEACKFPNPKPRASLRYGGSWIPGSSLGGSSCCSKVGNRESMAFALEQPSIAPFLPYMHRGTLAEVRLRGVVVVPPPARAINWSRSYHVSHSRTASVESRSDTRLFQWQGCDTSIGVGLHLVRKKAEYKSRAVCQPFRATRCALTISPMLGERSFCFGLPTKKKKDSR